MRELGTPIEEYSLRLFALCVCSPASSSKPFVCLSACLLVRLAVVCLFACLLVCLSVCLSVCLFVCLFVSVFVCERLRVIIQSLRVFRRASSRVRVWESYADRILAYLVSWCPGFRLLCSVSCLFDASLQSSQIARLYQTLVPRAVFAHNPHT